tara:strand:+ start:1774 stop:3987 length:2214 start_codon:yes stop_codon:yes gene_type:complete
MAAEGKNKVAQSLVDMQPTAILELFRIYPDRVNLPTLYLGFHGGSNFEKSITWQGVDYLPLAIECEGFDILGDGKLARPKIKIANRNNLVTNFLQNYKDLINAKIVRKKVQVKFLDDSNFDGGNPFGSADAKAELASETWIMGRKTQESKVFVEFELNSPLDLENFSVNSRNVVAKYCGFQYRGEGCRYAGFPIERDDASPFVDADNKAVVPVYNGPPPLSFLESNYAKWNPTSGYSKGDIVWVESPTINVPPLSENPNDTTKYPLKTVYVAVTGDGSTVNSGQPPANNPSYWQKDGCSKRLSACQKRFTQRSDLTFVGGNIVNKSFPAVKISGKNRNGSAYRGDNTGFFHTNEPNITGILTGEFTLMGWAHVTTNSSWKAGLFATSQADYGVFPAARYLNIYSEPRFTNWSFGGGGLVATTLGYEISPRTDGRSSRRTIYNMTSLNKLQNMQGNSEVENWNQYIVTHRKDNYAAGEGPNALINGEGVDQITQMDFYLNGELKEEQNRVRVGSNRAANRDNHILGNFGSLAQRYAIAWNDAGADRKLFPTCFMIGGQEYFGTNSTQGYEAGQVSSINCINGHIGTWALWNRVLTDQEIAFLRHTPLTSDDAPNTIPQVPRLYSECTGRMSTLTGGTGWSEVGGLTSDDQALLYGANSLVAWWDGTTGNIGSVTHPTGGLMDVHKYGYHLTGSGSFEQVSKSYFEGDATIVKNPTPRNPRFGGFPGTDGFSYGRDTSF